MDWKAIVIKSDKYATPYPLSVRFGDEFDRIKAETEDEALAALRVLLAQAPRWAWAATARGDIIVSRRYYGWDVIETDHD